MEIRKTSLIIFLMIASNVFGLSKQNHGADVELTADGATFIFNNNSFTYSFMASGSMSESQAITFPIADGSAGQQLTTNGSNVWSWTDPTGGVAGAHTMLNNAGLHTNTAAGSTTRGGIMFVNSTPLWDELAIGAANEFLKSDGTDIDWGFIDISDSTNLAVTTPITLTGDSIGIVNQGTTTTVLHGDAAGNAAFGIVDISDDTNLAVDTDHLKLTDDTLSFSDEEKVLSHDRQDSFLEQLDFTISESSGTVTGFLEKEGGGDLTQFWSDDFDVLDCTPAEQVDLTGSVGTDTSPAAAFVYILFSGKTTLVVNTSWPANSVEHIRIASIVLQSATTTGTNGALMNRNWNDMAFGITNPKGGAIISNQRTRKDHAQWDSGVVLSVTGSGTSTITIATTTGVVFQLNPQSFPSVDMAGADDIHLVNLSGSEFSTSVNLVADITTLADGITSLGNNKFWNIVVWGAQNRTGQASHLMCNLPIGQYGKQSDATVDAEKFSVHTIPDDFRGIGFLIAELTFKLTGGGSTWTLVQNKDLLGQLPILIPGGGTTNNITTFVDSAFEVFDNLEDTKRIAFQASSVSTGETRVITMADANVDLADIATNTTAIGLNTTHSTSSDGSDHSFIDQSVISGATPTFTATNFNGISGITGLGVQVQPLDMGLLNITKPGDIDGSVDASANADAGTVDAQYSLEGVLTELNAGTPLTPDVGSVGIYCDRGTKKGLRGDGTEFYEAVAYVPATGNAKRAVSFLFRVPDGDAGTGAFWGWGDNGSTAAGRIDFRVANGIIQVTFRGSNLTLVTTGWNDGLWHHCLFTHDGVGAIDVAGTKIIINGVDESYAGSSGIGVTLNTGSIALTVMSGRPTGAAIVPDGWCMDEFAIYVAGTLPDITDAQNIYQRQRTKYIGGSTNSFTDWSETGNAKGNFATAGSGTFGKDLTVGASAFSVEASTGNVNTPGKVEADGIIDSLTGFISNSQTGITTTFVIANGDTVTVTGGIITNIGP